MSSKHTPGPWSIEDDTPFSLWVSCPDGKNPLHQNRLNRDRLANARLMAAAPELLDALIEAVACGMVPISSTKDGGASTHSRQVRCADMIRAAIAKATGGAQ